MSNVLSNKKIILGVTGSIAAYKAMEIASTLTQSNASLEILLTKEATEFVTPLSFRNISGQNVNVDLFNDKDHSYLNHVRSSQNADAFLIAPATANTIAKLANGIADDLITTTFLTATCPVIIAPAMDANMFDNPSTKRNVDILLDRGITFAGPATGRLASGQSGKGRLMEPAAIIDTLKYIIGKSGDFSGQSIVVTAGPTAEHIDPVRVITNQSSGKMGFAIARSARDRGASVTLISGPSGLQTPIGINHISVISAAEMYEAVSNVVKSATILIMAAAVSDYRPSNYNSLKFKKNQGVPSLELELTKDILMNVPNNLLKIGFAAETNDIEENAIVKLTSKNLDLIVANDVSDPTIGFGSDLNKVTIIDRHGNTYPLPLLPKSQVAWKLLDHILPLCY